MGPGMHIDSVGVRIRMLPLNPEERAEGGKGQKGRGPLYKLL